MKKTLALILALSVVLCFVLAGCSFAWDDTETGLQIKDIYSVTDDGGVVYLEIAYTNSDTVDRYPLPQGNGIGKTSYTYDDTNRETVVTLTYDNGDTAIVRVPYGRDGEDGASMNVVKLSTDLSGVPWLVFYYESADGTLAEQGRVDVSQMKGEDGLGIEKWEPFSDELGSGVKVTMSGKEPTVHYFNYKQQVSCELVGHQYVVTILSADPNQEPMVFHLTRQPTWLQGDLTPNDEQDGIAGDFYYDRTRQAIWTKIGSDPNDVTKGYWIQVASLQKEETNLCTVTFDPGLGTIPGYEMYQTANGYVFNKIPYGSYFLDKYQEIPTPTLDGFRFLGWYRKFATGTGEVAFNDFVQICSDLTLYARWEKIEG